MKVNLLYLFFLLPVLAAAQPDEMNLDSLKKLAQQQMDDDQSNWAEMELLTEPIPEDSTQSEPEPPNPKLDSAIVAVLVDYPKKGFCLYTFDGRPNTQQYLMETKYAVFFYPVDTTDNIDYDYQYYYNACMKALFRQKYGWNIFQKLFIEAQKLDGSGKGTRRAAFPGGVDEMYRYLYCNLDLLGTKEKEADDHNYYVAIQIDGQGKIDSIEIRNASYDDPNSYNHKPTDEELKEYAKKLAADKKYLDEVTRLVKLMPAWVPATENGQPVRGETWFTVYFSKSTKQHYKCKK